MLYILKECPFKSTEQRSRYHFQYNSERRANAWPLCTDQNMFWIKYRLWIVIKTNHATERIWVGRYHDTTSLFLPLVLTTKHPSNSVVWYCRMKTPSQYDTCHYMNIIYDYIFCYGQDSYTKYTDKCYSYTLFIEYGKTSSPAYCNMPSNRCYIVTMSLSDIIKWWWLRPLAYTGSYI